MPIATHERARNVLLRIGLARLREQAGQLFIVHGLGSPAQVAEVVQRKITV